jgi:hypothetical protein
MARTYPPFGAIAEVCAPFNWTAKNRPIFCIVMGVWRISIVAEPLALLGQYP